MLMSACDIIKFPQYLYGLINTEGEYIVKPVFTGIKIGNEGFFPVRQGIDEYYKWGFCDYKGNVVIDFQYLDVSIFSNGFAPVQLYDTELWSFIDTQNNIAFEKEFMYALPFSEGLACVQSNVKDETYSLWGYIDTTGEYVIDPQYDAAASFS
jgi:hypothetical protein